LYSAASAYLYSGQTDLSAFFDHLPARFLSEGLNILGSIQAATGDLDGARETYDRLAFEHPNSELRLLGNEEFTRGLIRRGSLKEALDLAFQRGNAILLAEIAFGLE
jgi:hypothetical protein